MSAYRITQQGTLIAALLLLAACGSAESRGGAAPQASTMAPVSPVITAPEPAEADSPGALVKGTLERADDCLYLNGVPIIWVAGTTWDESAAKVRTPDGSSVAVGGDVSGGGGQVSEVGTVYGEEVADRVAKCSDGGDKAVYISGASTA